MRTPLIYLVSITISIWYILSLTGCIDGQAQVVEDTSNPYANYNDPIRYDTLETVTIIHDSVFYIDEIREVQYDSISSEFIAVLVDTINKKFAQGEKVTPTYLDQYDSTFYYVEPFELVFNPNDSLAPDTNFNVLPFNASTRDSILFMVNDSVTQKTFYIRVTFDLKYSIELDSFVIDTLPYDTIPYGEYVRSDTTTITVETDAQNLQGTTTPITILNRFGSPIQLEMWRGEKPLDKTSSYTISYQQSTGEITGYQLVKFASTELKNTQGENSYVIPTSTEHSLLVVIGYKTYSNDVEYLDHVVIESPAANELFIDNNAQLQEIFE